MNNECCENNVEERNCCCDCHENDCDKTRKEMLMQIKEYDFALDTHPDDSKALCLHNNYSRTLRELETEYQRVYGPLTANYPCKKWRWLEEPWPWERGIM